MSISEYSIKEKSITELIVTLTDYGFGDHVFNMENESLDRLFSVIESINKSLKKKNSSKEREDQLLKIITGLLCIIEQKDNARQE